MINSCGCCRHQKWPFNQESCLLKLSTVKGDLKEGNLCRMMILDSSDHHQHNPSAPTQFQNDGSHQITPNPYFASDFWSKTTLQPHIGNHKSRFITLQQDFEPRFHVEMKQEKKLQMKDRLLDLKLGLSHSEVDNGEDKYSEMDTMLSLSL